MRTSALLRALSKSARPLHQFTLGHDLLSVCSVGMYALVCISVFVFEKCGIAYNLSGFFC